VAHIKRHIAEYGAAPDGRLLRGIRAERLSEVTVGRAWRRARKAALSTREAASTLAKRPYDLRHVAVSTWLNAGVQPTLAAEWAGHGVQVLLRVYAKCIEGQDAQSRKLVENALGGPGQHKAEGDKENQAEPDEPREGEDEAA